MERFLSRFGKVWKGPSLNDLEGQAAPSTNGQNSTTIDASLAMTSWEIKVLKKSWNALRRQNIGICMFTSVFDKDPNAMAVFGLRNASLRTAVNDYRVRRQALIVEDTIDMVILDLEKGGDGLCKSLVVLGEQHGRLMSRGFRQHYWLLLGQALLDLVAQHGAMGRIQRWKVQRLWRRLLYFMFRCLSAGVLLAKEKEAEMLRNKKSKNEGSLLGSLLLDASHEDLEIDGRRPSKVESTLLEMMALTIPVRL